MQTFLPYANFEKSLSCLDNARLGKQRVEAMQILNYLTGKNPTSSWRNHVAVRMWEGYETALMYYHNLSLVLWMNRGKVNNMAFYPIDEDDIIVPDWIGDEYFHRSHKCNLLRKDYEHYSKFFGENKYDIAAPYYWPVPLKTKKKQEEMVEYWYRKNGLIY
jgi:hypothetical protein